MRSPALLLAATVVSLALAACGGGNPEGTTTRAPRQLALLTSTETGATFLGKRSNYTIAAGANGYTVTDVTSGAAVVIKSTALSLSFADATVNLGIGQVAQTVADADLNTIVELYIAFFGRVPDADGLAYWVGKRAGGMTLDAIADGFYAASVSPEFSTLTGYSAGLGNEAFVKIVYQNVLAKPADSDGLAYWTAKLATRSRGSLVRELLGAAHTFKGDSTLGYVPDRLDNLIAVGKYSAVQQGLSFGAYAQSVAIAARVTPTDTSAAIAQVGNIDTSFSLASYTTAPLIAAQPVDRSAVAGASVTFTVTVIGSGPLRYQWQRNGVDIAGATAATYVLPDMQAADGGSKWAVVVTNAAGSAKSAPVTLTLAQAELIAGSPSGNVLDGYGAGILRGSDGNFYLGGGKRVIKLSKNGVASTLVGSGSSGSTDGTWATASFVNAYQLVDDGVGGFYVADTGGYTIRQVTPNGEVTTLAGSAGNSGARDGLGTFAMFGGSFMGMARDRAGNLFIADAGNHTIRKIGSDRNVSTFAGRAGQGGALDGKGSEARFLSPQGLVLDAQGNLYVADSGNGLIRKISPAGEVTTIAGETRKYCDNDGLGSKAHFLWPASITIDAEGMLYVVDTGNTAVRKVTREGQVTTLVPGATRFDNNCKNIGQSAVYPFHVSVLRGGITVGDDGNIYVTGYYGVYRITPAGIVTALFDPGLGPSVDGKGTDARFSRIAGVVAGPDGSLYVTDLENPTVRLVSSDRTVSTLAGKTGTGISGYVDGSGTAVRFTQPKGIGRDPQGNLYVAESSISIIRKVTAGGVATTFAGRYGLFGYEDGDGTAARMGNPAGIAVDSAGNIYIADSGNSLIRKIRPDGVVSTVAGLSSGYRDGVGFNAAFNRPSAIAIDRNGNLYIADTDNHVIRKIGATGAVTTLAGQAGTCGNTNGAAAAARFCSPAGIAVDGAGNVYVAEPKNHLLRRITPSGLVSTVAGTPGLVGNSLETLPGSLYAPQAVAIDSSGAIILASGKGIYRIER